MQNRSPIISVIVPVYGVEPYLRRCVDSILAQKTSSSDRSFRDAHSLSDSKLPDFDFELILVDDGSPDRCGEICDEYAKKDARVVVIHQKNGGLSAARNAGIDWAFKNSTSEYLTFIDSDDWVAPIFLQELYGALRDATASIAVCTYARPADVTSAPAVGHVAFERLSPAEFWLKGRVIANIACCKLYRKSLFEKIRFPVGRINEDAFVTYRVVFASSGIAFTTASLYYYFIRPESIMQRPWTSARIAEVDAMEEQMEFFGRCGHPELVDFVAEYCINDLLLCELAGARECGDTVAVSALRRRLRRIVRTHRRLVHLSGGDSIGRRVYIEAYPPCGRVMYLVARIFEAFRRRGIIGIICHGFSRFLDTSKGESSNEI